jgi:hypothetical protein
MGSIVSEFLEEALQVEVEVEVNKVLQQLHSI